MPLSIDDFFVHVRTGDVQGAGTDADVGIIFHDINNQTSDRINLCNFFKNDFERGKNDEFKIPKRKVSHLGKIDKIEIYRNNSGFGSFWFVERITVENRSTGGEYIFPVFRWLRPHYHYIFREHDTSLPQDDEQKEQRKLDLEETRKSYEIDMTDPEFPAMIKTLPRQEQFSNQYQWDITKLKITLLAKSKLQALTTDNWKTTDDIKNIYKKSVFYEPKSTETWFEDSFFGHQRLNGPAPNLIRLCSKIPEKLAVKEEDITPFLEGHCVKQVLEEKKLFYCDLEILHGEKLKTGEAMCAPIVLLYRNLDDQLLPIAIQLYQEPSPDNPVFHPSDDEQTWLLAKMWYNHAETAYHQSLTHLGFTHLLMEGVCLALHRNVSISHPIFKLLAPHLMYLLAINNRAVRKLLSPGEWIDKTMPAGCDGVINIVKKGFKFWRMDVDGSLPEDLKERGVYDKDVLPDYHYRDDALLLYEAIHTFVKEYVNIYYDTPSKLEEDIEIQAWASEMKKERKDGGMAIKGIPGNGEFNELGQLVKALTSIIFTSSVQHAAVNFPQYDFYGFPLTYPVHMRGAPPADKKPRQKSDLLSYLPDKSTTFNVMVVTTILSNKGTNSLGDYEIQYISDPKANHLVENFKEDVKRIGETIASRNNLRDNPYDYLHPESIPNSISI